MFRYTARFGFGEMFDLQQNPEYWQRYNANIPERILVAAYKAFKLNKEGHNDIVYPLTVIMSITWNDVDNIVLLIVYNSMCVINASAP